jgi:hypothetical protein
MRAGVSPVRMPATLEELGESEERAARSRLPHPFPSTSRRIAAMVWAFAPFVVELFTAGFFVRSPTAGSCLPVPPHTNLEAPHASLGVDRFTTLQCVAGHEARSGRAAFVTMMESTDFWDGHDGAIFRRHNRTRDRRVFVQRQMRTRPLVV